MKKVMIFGAGVYGRKAYLEYGKEKIDGFIDNSKEKQGSIYCGKTIYSLEDVLSNKNDYHIIIASTYSSSIINQLRAYDIVDYSVYVDPNHGYYDTNELIVNPYEVQNEADSEDMWSNSERMQYSRKAVFDEVENLYKKRSLFNHIEVETVNQCNGTCSFCPVNRKIDPREKIFMSDQLFKNIVKQLSDMNYSGRFSTFSNNEPLLDDRIIKFNRYARNQLPNARMHLFTNGTLLTLEKFIELVEILDELIIDNYQQELKLIKPCEQIRDYCEKHPILKKKVTIVLRKPQEILTSRGGTAPNRSVLKEYGHDRCILPFKQVIIRPDGKISLCCNDAIGQYTLGDLEKEKLIDIWYGPKFEIVRESLYKGRENWGNCKKCDTFSMG